MISWPLLLTGYVLGFSVAWPPGPINAEVMRRGLTHGFRPAFIFGAGACCGDAVWAVIAGTGAALLAKVGAVEGLLRPVSGAILLALAAHYAWGAWRAASMPMAAPKPISNAGGFLIAFTIALTSPWNLAFWLGVLGMPEIASAGARGTAAITVGVIGGAASWVIILSTISSQMKRRVEGRSWDVATRVITALVLTYFGARLFLA